MAILICKLHVSVLFFTTRQLFITNVAGFSKTLKNLPIILGQQNLPKEQAYMILKNQFQQFQTKSFLFLKIFRTCIVLRRRFDMKLNITFSTKFTNLNTTSIGPKESEHFPSTSIRKQRSKFPVGAPAIENKNRKRSASFGTANLQQRVSALAGRGWRPHARSISPGQGEFVCGQRRPKKLQLRQHRRPSFKWTRATNNESFKAITAQSCEWHPIWTKRTRGGTNGTKCRTSGSSRGDVVVTGKKFIKVAQIQIVYIWRFWPKNQIWEKSNLM